MGLTVSGRDRVYRRRRGQVADFAFDDKVAAVFPDMIRRSVPGYDTVIAVTGLLAARELLASRRTPRLYDLGCSLGATSLAALRHVGDLPCSITAVDASEPMIERARTLLADPRVSLVCSDIRSLALEPCRVVALNYVLQFLPQADRVPLLQRIREALEPEGLLVLSEKVRFDDPVTQQDFEATHLDYKRANGYSELEISQKRTALESVMDVDTEEAHVARLRGAGFSRVETWYRCLNWASLLARP